MRELEFQLEASVSERGFSGTSIGSPRRGDVGIRNTDCRSSDSVGINRCCARWPEDNASSLQGHTVVLMAVLSFKRRQLGPHLETCTVIEGSFSIGNLWYWRRMRAELLTRRRIRSYGIDFASRRKIRLEGGNRMNIRLSVY